MTINTSKEYLENLITELVKVGESKEELSMWLELYDILSPEEREKIVGNFEKELEQLRKLK